MAALGAATHDFAAYNCKVVGSRAKRGHDT